MRAGSAVERWGLSGHDDAVEHLAVSLSSGRFPHAYLVTGPEGVGRKALALALARALNCEATPEERPCNQCDSCRRIARGAHPDITVVDFGWQVQMIPRKKGDPPRQRLSIDAVKWLRADIVNRPLLGRWKVQIITESEYLSGDATNAFLKTLEEPPPFAVIVLIAHSVDAVPETIASRCQVVPLGSVRAEIIHDVLLARGLRDPDALNLARAARGRIAWAIAMAGNPEQLSRRREKIEQSLNQIQTPLGRVSISGVIARDFSKKREATLESVDYWTGLWRDALLYRCGLPDHTAFPEVGDQLKHYASRWQVEDLYRALWATRRCALDLESNVNARIALHAMVMQWPE